MSARFNTWFASLPSYGEAGQGFTIMLWKKRNNGKFKQYPCNRYHVGAGRTARVYTDRTGKQYIIAMFVNVGSNVYVSNAAAWAYLNGWCPAPASNVENNANNNFQRLSVAQAYPFWRELDQPENPFLMIYPSEENQLLSAAGFNRIPFDGDLIVVDTGRNPQDTNSNQTTTLEQRSASNTPVLIIAGFALLIVSGLILTLYKK